MLQSPHMPLTPAQQAKVKQILSEYKKEVHSVLKKHQSQITKIVEDIDKKKTEKIKRMIEGS